MRLNSNTSVWTFHLRRAWRIQPAAFGSIRTELRLFQWNPRDAAGMPGHLLEWGGSFGRTASVTQQSYLLLAVFLWASFYFITGYTNITSRPHVWGNHLASSWFYLIITCKVALGSTEQVQLTLFSSFSSSWRSLIRSSLLLIGIADSVSESVCGGEVSPKGSGQVCHLVVTGVFPQLLDPAEEVRRRHRPVRDVSLLSSCCKQHVSNRCVFKHDDMYMRVAGLVDVGAHLDWWNNSRSC